MYALLDGMVVEMLKMKLLPHERYTILDPVAFAVDANIRKTVLKTAISDIKFKSRRVFSFVILEWS